MWDVQTGGLIHTFTTQSKVSDIAISTSGDHIACGKSNGYVTFWNTHTKVEGKGFGNGQPVVTICWLSPQKLAVATQNSLYIHNVAAGETLDSLSFPNCVWGMVYFGDEDEFLVGTSQQGQGGDQELCLFETTSHRRPEPLEKRQSMIHRGRLVRRRIYRGRQSPTHSGQLTYPTAVGKEIVCITLPSGVRSFSPKSYDWTSKPPLLDMATSVAVSLNRNLVAQTKDSIQIFSVDVLTSREVHNDVRPSYVYPLGKEYILCVLQPNKHLTLLESETLQELRPDDETLPFRPLLHGQSPSTYASFYSGLITRFGILETIQAWGLGKPLPEQIEIAEEQKLLYGLSPACTTEVVITYNSTGRVAIWVHSPGNWGLSAVLGDVWFRSEEVYDITFDSETRFYLKVDGPRQHVQIPYDIFPSSTRSKITKGEPVPLLKPRETPPYALDANCEWVLDAKSRKICWISPGNIRRGDGGHFWNGLSLIMVGDDGVVRKVSFKDPVC